MILVSQSSILAVQCMLSRKVWATCIKMTREVWWSWTIVQSNIISELLCIQCGFILFVWNYFQPITRYTYMKKTFLHPSSFDIIFSIWSSLSMLNLLYVCLFVGHFCALSNKVVSSESLHQFVAKHEHE